MTTLVRLAIAVLALCGAARAAEARAPSAWRVPDECGGSARLTARVAVHAGRPLTDTDAISVDVAIVARAEGGYLGTVDVISVRGAARREVAGADCAAVVDAVALVLAVAMQEAPRQRVDLEEPRPPSPPPPPRFLVGAGLGVEQGALPSSSPGASMRIAVVQGPWRVEAGGEVYQAAYAATPTDPMKGLDVGLVGGWARLCRRMGPLRGCAGGAVGRIEGRPVDLDQPSTESRRWSGLTAGVGWSYRFGGRFGLALDVDGVVALDRPEFILRDGTLLHQPAAGGIRAGCGLEVEIR